ncbi:polynucleotide adenylyltransferase PcnB [Pelistega europaea]|uniref:Poly(A) polymerase I n=1 Tax=Pelistega europaea TaxID=106147 RepID=A0A7Y4LAZ2_9BURK|nr:polynucleotide adenylyltransferase PcnB [Pelistega europaea]NOL50260.1 polynucleotide adenylyltransferase PcnB [Pelistega europaea]
MLVKTFSQYMARLFSGKKHTDNTPTVYTAAEHQIDIRLVSRNAIKVCEVLQGKGYQAYIVGGAVRDLILGHEPKDFDVATNATPEQVRACFRRARIIGRRFRLVHVVFGSEIIETSTFRAAGKQITDDQGRILNDNVFGDICSDAARRDFTLNALYYDPIKQEVIDYHQGVDDLHKRLVRIIGDPETRYREDPVRMLRAIRFAAKLDARIEPHTLKPIKSLAHLISNVPASRLFDETFKLLTCGHALNCLRQLRAEGLHQGILPLLDLVLQQEGSHQLIELTLERTDHRIRSNKHISASFLYAALLWPLVQAYQKEAMAQGVLPVPALVEATGRVLEEQVQQLALQKRHSSEMREIWLMQPRFNKRQPKFIWRMIQQPYFRAACDFLQIRAACHEFDSVLAQWWMDLANAPDAERATMINEIPKTQSKASKSQRTAAKRKTSKTEGVAENLMNADKTRTGSLEEVSATIPIQGDSPNITKDENKRPARRRYRTRRRASKKQWAAAQE